MNNGDEILNKIKKRKSTIFGALLLFFVLKLISIHNVWINRVAIAKIFMIKNPFDTSKPAFV